MKMKETIYVTFREHLVSNLTPHPITVIRPGRDTITIPPSDPIPRITIRVSSKEGTFVDVRKEEVLDLPKISSDNVVYIVSQLVAWACPERHDLYFPYPLIRGKNEKIIGCRGFARPQPPQEWLAKEEENEDEEREDEREDEYGEWYGILEESH